MRSTANLSYDTIMYINTRFRHSCKTIDILIEKREKTCKEYFFKSKRAQEVQMLLC